MRTYGTYRFIPANASDHPYYGGRTGLWVLTVEPAVAIRVKRTFARVKATRTGAVTIAHSIEVARDLTWFTERFPLTAHDERSYCELLDGDTAHRELEEQVTIALRGDREREHTDHTPAVPPRPYQQTAADMLRTVRRLLLTDDLGLGKTYSASLNFLHDDALPAVVVGPTHLVAKGDRWANELDKHFPHLTYYVAKTGKSAEIDKLKVMPDVIFLSYTKLAGWVDFLSEWAKYVVFDEVQELRNGTDTSKGTAAAHLCQSVTYAIGLTATPVMNYAGEMWSILDVINPGVLGTREEFLREWGQTSWSNHIKVADPHALGSYLREQGLMLGRTREEVGMQLPKTIKVTHRIDSDRKVLDDMEASARALAQTILSETATGEERFHASGEIDKMVRHATGVAKAPHVAEFCHMILEDEQKIVLFGWHRDCFAPGTQVMMYDGTAKSVEDVQVGDLVMGPDSGPRAVQGLVAGKGNLYQITPNKGEPWVCSENHILTVWNSQAKRYEKWTAKEFAGRSPRWQRDRMLYRADTVSFTEASSVVEPWMVGYWLGDGAAALRDLRFASSDLDPEVEAEMSEIAQRWGLKLNKWRSTGDLGVHLNLSTGTHSGPKNRHTLLVHLRSLGLAKNKHIPMSYKTASTKERQELLAGLIDSDGHVFKHKNSVGSASYTSIYRTLADDVAFLARSLGIAAYVIKKKASISGYGRASEDHYVVNISGDLTQLPMRIARKKAAARSGQKSVLRTGFTIEPAGTGDYFGFEVDEDHLFLLHDFTVVHNCYSVWMDRLAKFKPVLYTGTESPTQKTAALDAFKNGDSRILIMSLRSGAGVDGLEKVARVAVFGELDWSPQVHEQGIGRLRRGDITDPPVAYYLVSEDGSDPAVAEVLQVKRQQGDALMSKDGKLLANATADVNRTRMLAQAILAR